MANDRGIRVVVGVLVGGALALVCCLGAFGLGIVGAGGTPQANPGPSSTTNLTVGTAVGDMAPAFRLVDVDGGTVTRDSLIGEPAVLWFTTSYCVPCQEGAVAFQRVLAKTDLADQVHVLMAFIDPGEPSDALTEWKARFGSPDWRYALASETMVIDYHVQYLDSKYLLDRDGVVRVADFLPLDEDAWVRHLRDLAG